MLKLGTQTGSLVNHLHSRGTIGQPKPEVGMGCTFLSWSDRNPGTIYKVEEYVSGKTWGYFIYCRNDEVDWDPETKEQTFTPRTEGLGRVYRSKNPRGEPNNSSWTQVCQNETTGRWNKVDGAGIRIGEKEYYRDPHF